MKLLPRRPSADPAADAAVDDYDEAAAEAEAAAGRTPKGRPTPKRRDVQNRRGPVTAPKTRKEAAARQREVRTQKRSTAAQPMPKTAGERREALRSGEILAKRDQGKTRKLARDYVDSHRMLSNYLLLLFPIMIVSYLLPVLQVLILVAFLGLLTEWYITGRRLRALAIERFGSAEGGNLSIGFYAGSRAYLPRRWRLPAPQVKRGDPI